MGGNRERTASLIDLEEVASYFGRSSVLSKTAWELGEALHHRSLRRDGDGGGGGVESRSRIETNVPVGYRGPDEDPIDPRPRAGESPVLTAYDVTDYGAANCVADPFLYRTDGEWHMFVEVFNRERSPSAVIGHAVSDDSGRTWTYDGVVLRTSAHLSYPFVFEWEGDQYMVPDAWSKDSRRPADVTLYRAREFPRQWTETNAIVSPDRPIHDCTVFRWDDRWWALAGDGRDLYAYYSDELEADDWTPHDHNPVVEGRLEAARPGGRPVVRDDYVLVFLQDCVNQYGAKLRAYEITELSPSTYRDAEADGSPVLRGGPETFGWKSGAMHHIDPQHVGDRWYCAVDANIGLGWQVFGDHHWVVDIYEA